MGIFNVARSVKAGGLTGLLALAVVYGAQRIGVDISAEEAGVIVGILITLVTHLVPDSTKQTVDALAKKLDMSARELADKVPEIEETYPGDIKPDLKDRNFNKGE
jgi:hypothetical protein